MTDTPIFSVEIDDGEFKKFAELFDRYKAEAAETPAAWAEANNFATSAKTNFEKINKILTKLNASDEGEKQAKAVKQSRYLEVAWAGAAKSAKLFYQNVQGGTLSLMKWTGLTAVFGSLLSAGGLYGISRMAANVSAGRSNAMGLGVSYGEQASFGRNFERIGNTEGILSAFNQALHGANNIAPLMSIMGGNASQRLAGKNASGAFAEALPDIQRILKGAPSGALKQTADAYKLGELGIDLQTAQVIRNMSPDEIKEMIRNHKSTAERLNLDPSTQLAFQNFITQLDRAEASIGTSFARSLAHLTPGLTKFSDGLVNLFEHLLANGGPMERWLKDAGKGIENFAKQMQGEEFDRSVHKALAVIKDFGKLVAQVVSGAGAVRNPDSGLFGQAPGSAGQAKANRWLNAIFGTNRAPTAAQRYEHVRPAPGLGVGVRAGARQVSASEFPPMAGETEGQLAARIQSLRPSLSSQECVALAKAAVGSNASVSTWRRGENVFGKNLPIGTPLATFMDRRGNPSERYDGGQGVGVRGNNTTHAGVFAGYVRDGNGNIVGMKMSEQYRGSGGDHIKVYRYGDTRGGAKDARNYFSVNGADGKPLGPHNPMRSSPLFNTNNPQLQGGGERHTVVETTETSVDVNVKSSPYGALPRGQMNWSPAR